MFMGTEAHITCGYFFAKGRLRICKDFTLATKKKKKRFKTLCKGLRNGSGSKVFTLLP